MAKKAATKSVTPVLDKQTLYRLEVDILSGPVTEKFWDKNPRICRTIEILGDQTLEFLHFAIFDAYHREEEHLYEFILPGKSKKESRRFLQDIGAYRTPDDCEAFVEQTTLQSLGLKPKAKFSYMFDFGDNWRHEIQVIEIGEPNPRAKYPRVTERIGRNPPQYPDW